MLHILKKQTITGTSICYLILLTTRHLFSIVDDPRNVTIEYMSANVDIWEGDDDILIRCNADCNPPCDKYIIYHNNEQISTSKETKITTDRKNSGQYTCSASNNFRQKYVSSNNTVNVTIKCE